MRELISAKGAVEYSAAVLTFSKAESLVRRAPFLVELAARIVRLGQLTHTTRHAGTRPLPQATRAAATRARSPR